ncbi:MAG: cob(I)yrinic acid a,c-diamide adenosyltransferase [Bacteroidales bacterium]|nr:cob(I)yrinic acid a,c-diamide adenosyltransferase [Bacteroidales bacterium]
MKIYTRSGDDGTTSLADGQRVPKFHPRIEACGTIDELISWIGLLRGFHENESRIQTLLFIQDNLMRFAAILSLPGKDEPETGDRMSARESLLFLENEIDTLESKLPLLDHFILPGGHVLVAYCHIARCVCRRTERKVLLLNNSVKIPSSIFKFLNRLSDYLFVLARTISIEVDNDEVMWRG